MPVALDAVAGASTPSTGTGALTLPWSHTVGGGSEKLLVVEVLLDTTFQSQVQSVTFAGANLTRLQRGSSLSGQVLERWILMNPTGGVGTVTITLPGSTGTPILGFSRSFTGVDQQNPFGMPGKVDASGSFSTITNTFTVEGATGDMALYWWGSDPGGFANGDGSETVDGTNLSVSTTTSGVVQRAAALRKAWTAGSTIAITNPSFSAVVTRAALLLVRLRASGNANTPLLGTKNIGNAFVTPAGGEIRVYRHYVASLVGLTGIQCRMDGNGSTVADSPHRMVIYNATGTNGNPGTLVAVSAEVTIPAGAAEAWVRFPFSGVVYLPAGVYWIGFHDGGTVGANCVRIRTLDTQTFTGAFDNDTYTDGTNLVFVQPPTDKAFEPSFYAEGVASGGGGGGVSGATTSVLHPAASQLVRGTIALGVQIVTTIPVLGVQWKLDGANYGTEVLTAPWTNELDTTTLSNGNHTVQAIVRDANGTATTAVITFAVSNTLPSLGVAPVRAILPPRVRVEVDWPHDFAGAQYKDIVPGAGPLRWYRLSESSGGAGAADATGNAVAGTFTGSFTFTRTGPITGEPADKAILFGNGATLTIPGQAAMVDGMGVSFWFKPGSSPSPGFYPNLFRARPNITFAYLPSTGQVSISGSASSLYYTFSVFNLLTAPGSVLAGWNKLDVIYGDFDNWLIDPTTGKLVRSDNDGGVALKSRSVTVLLNGAWAGDIVWPSITGDPLADTSGAWTLGDDFGSGATVEFDELQIYEAVDQADLINQYNAAPNVSPAAATYTDLTSRVQSISIQRGGAESQGPASPAAAAVYMHNDDRYLEPKYSGSADYPNIKVGKRVRVLIGENYLANPRAETGLSDWSVFATGTGLSLTRKVDEWIEPVGETAFEAAATVTSAAFLELYATTPPINYKAVTVDEVLHLSAWVRRVTGNVSSIEVRARALDSSFNFVSENAVASVSSSLDSYQRIGGSFTVPSGVAWVSISVYFNGVNALMRGRATGLQLVSGAGLQAYVDEPTGFVGQIERLPQSRRSYRRGVVPLTATGALSLLAQGKVKGTLPRQLPGVRINRLLSSALWPTTDRLIDAGLRQLARETITGDGEDPKAHAQQAAQSDLGVVFEDGLGRAVFHDGLHRSTVVASAAPRMIVGDGGTLAGEYPFADIDDADSDIQTVENTIRGTRPGGSEVVLSDAASQRQYWPREGATFATKLDSQDDLIQIIAARLAKRKDPQYQIHGLTLDPLRHPGLWTHVLSREVSDRIMLHQRPQQVGSVSRIACYIEAVDLRIELQEGTGVINARCVWRLSQP